MIETEQKSQLPTVIAAIFTVAAVFGGFIYIDRNPKLRDWLFGGNQQDLFVVGGSRLAEIIDQIKVSKREKWKEKLDDLRNIENKLDRLRQARFADIKGGIGDNYLAEFQQLTKDLHHIDRTRFGEFTKEDLAKLAKDGPINVDDPKVELDWIFAAAKESELRLTNYYREIKAAYNAINLKVPPVDAIGWVKVVVPQRISLVSKALREPVTTKEALDAFKDQINAGASSMDAMLAAGQNILKHLGELSGKGDATIDILAEGGGGSTRGDTLMPDELWLDDNGVTDGSFRPSPGRVIGPKGNDNQWMNLDCWYVMGPFDNRFRSNLDAAFLPETVVDLDNVTIGKGDKVIGWDYWSALPVRIEPPYADRQVIYYGWTQVRMPKAGKFWVALGSDDYGKMWLNGKLAWKSSTNSKAFKADEWVGELEFKEGVNDILFRCENNGGTMGWAMILNASQGNE